MSSMIGNLKDAVLGSSNTADNTPTSADSRTATTAPQFNSSTPTQETNTRTHESERPNMVDPFASAPTQQTTTAPSTTTALDPTDAAHVPPSVLKAEIGHPEVHHDYPEDSTAQRHSVSHQEAHIMR